MKTKTILLTALALLMGYQGARAEDYNATITYDFAGISSKTYAGSILEAAKGTVITAYDGQNYAMPTMGSNSSNCVPFIIDGEEFILTKGLRFYVKESSTSKGFLFQKSNNALKLGSKDSYIRIPGLAVGDRIELDIKATSSFYIGGGRAEIVTAESSSTFSYDKSDEVKIVTSKEKFEDFEAFEKLVLTVKTAGDFPIYSGAKSPGLWINKIVIKTNATVDPSYFTWGTGADAGKQPYKTFYTSYPLDLSTGENFNYYYAKSASGSTVTMSPVTGIVAGGEALLVERKASSFKSPNVVSFSTSASATTKDAAYVVEGAATLENLLVGAPVAKTLTQGTEKTYVFGYDSDKNYGLYGMKEATADATVPAGGAYLVTDTELTTGAGARLNLVFDDGETTGINNISVNANYNLNVNNAARYNLSGQRVGADYKGMVIVNGKKYLNK